MPVGQVEALEGNLIDLAGGRLLDVPVESEQLFAGEEARIKWFGVGPGDGAPVGHGRFAHIYH